MTAEARELCSYCKISHGVASALTTELSRAPENHGQATFGDAAHCLLRLLRAGEYRNSWILCQGDVLFFCYYFGCSSPAVSGAVDLNVSYVAVGCRRALGSPSKTTPPEQFRACTGRFTKLR